MMAVSPMSSLVKPNKVAARKRLGKLSVSSVSNSVVFAFVNCFLVTFYNICGLEYTQYSSCPYTSVTCVGLYMYGEVALFYTVATDVYRGCPFCACPPLPLWR